jgi:F-type H+-transporting ATPase subunit b
MLLAADAKFLDIISVNIWQMLISLANLLILFLILKHFLFRPVQKILAKRGEEVGSLYDEAETAKSEAEAARAEYDAKLKGADAEAEEILRRAQVKANERGDEIIAEAKSEADVLRRRAAEDIAQEKKKAINEIKDDISELSIEIAEQVVAREVREEDHRALVDRFIAELGENSHE